MLMERELQKAEKLKDLEINAKVVYMNKYMVNITWIFAKD
jgi:hypothetical protein